MYKLPSYFILLIFAVVIIFIALPLLGKSPNDAKYSVPISQKTKDVSDHTKDASDNQAATTRTMPKEDEIRTTDQSLQGNIKDDYAKNDLMKRWWKWLWTVVKWFWTIETLTFFLVIATLILAIAAVQQGRHIKRELVLTQRPRLRVSNVITKNFPDLYEQIDEPIMGQLYITNIGGMPAKIINVGCWVKLLQGGLPMERPYEGENPNYPITAKLMPGQSFPLTFVSDIKVGACDSVRRGLSVDILYIMGYVEYVDDIGNPRQSSFCREYRLPGKTIGEDKRARRFFAVDDPDYEDEE